MELTHLVLLSLLPLYLGLSQNLTEKDTLLQET